MILDPEQRERVIEDLKECGWNPVEIFGVIAPGLIENLTEGKRYLLIKAYSQEGNPADDRGHKEFFTRPHTLILSDLFLSKEIDHVLAAPAIKDWSIRVIGVYPKSREYDGLVVFSCGLYADKKRYSSAFSKNRARRHPYDEAKTDAEFLKKDPKAKAKRTLFDHQDSLCIYCGHKYRYDELEIEHMVPKVRGGPDHIRNCQLACSRCNYIKGTMTDREFRKANLDLLPAKERTPPASPIDPEALKGNGPERFLPSLYDAASARIEERAQREAKARRKRESEERARCVVAEAERKREAEEQAQREAEAERKREAGARAKLEREAKERAQREAEEQAQRGTQRHEENRNIAIVLGIVLVLALAWAFVYKMQTP